MERKFPIYITVDDISDAVLYEFINTRVQSGTLIPFVNALLRGYLLSPEVRQAQDAFLSLMGDLDTVESDLESLQRSNTMQGTLSGMLQDFTDNQAQSMGVSPTAPSPTPTQPQANPQAFLQGLVNSAVQSCIQGLVMQCLTPPQVGTPTVSTPMLMSAPAVGVPQPVQQPVQQAVPSPVVQVESAPVFAPTVAPTLAPAVEPVVEPMEPVVAKASTPVSAKPGGVTPAAFNKLLGSM